MALHLHWQLRVLRIKTSKGDAPESSGGTVERNGEKGGLDLTTQIQASIIGGSEFSEALGRGNDLGPKRVTEA